MNQSRTKPLAPVASRRFCGICGRMVGPGSLTIRAPIAYCGAHSDVPALDALPPDPLESLPTMADESAAVLLAAPPREDVPPANGSDPC